MADEPWPLRRGESYALVPYSLEFAEYPGFSEHLMRMAHKEAGRVDHYDVITVAQMDGKPRWYPMGDPLLNADRITLYARVYLFREVLRG